MTRTAIFTLLSLIMITTLSGCVSKKTYEAAQADLRSAASRYDTLQGDYQSLEEERAALVAERGELNDKLIASFKENSSLNRELIRVRAEAERSETGLQRERTVCQDELESARMQLSEKQDEVVALMEARKGLEDELEKERIAREARIANIKSTYDQLVGKMEDEIKRGEIQISELEGQLQVNMLASILFDIGDAEIGAAGKALLKRVGAVLIKVEDKAIVVEGHTDNLPISSRLKEQYPTNWELSVARATNVVRYLEKETGIPGERLVASGFGSHRPKADNSTAEGRAQNRRIQVVLAPLPKGK